MDTTCKWPDCERPRYTRGLCSMHAQRAYALDNFDEPWTLRTWEARGGYGPICRWPECERAKMTRGLCTKHYQRARKVNDYEAPWETWTRRNGVYDNDTCRWPDCENSSSVRGLCARDYYRAKVVGDFDEPWTWRTWVDRIDYGPECRWPDCDTTTNAHGLCKTHLGRAERMDNLEDPWVEWVGPNYYDDDSVCEDDGDCGRRPYANGVCRYHYSRTWKEVNRERASEQNRSASSRRRARMAGAETEVFTTADILELYGPDCYLCGEGPLDFDLAHPHPLSPSLDHIIPISKGGSHTTANCSFVHFHCNNVKHANLTDLRPVPIVK